MALCNNKNSPHVKFPHADDAYRAVLIFHQCSPYIDIADTPPNTKPPPYTLHDECIRKIEFYKPLSPPMSTLSMGGREKGAFRALAPMSVAYVHNSFAWPFVSPSGTEPSQRLKSGCEDENLSRALCFIYAAVTELAAIKMKYTRRRPFYLGSCLTRDVLR
jgi:hypothetical protein